MQYVVEKQNDIVVMRTKFPLKTLRGSFVCVLIAAASAIMWYDGLIADFWAWTRWTAVVFGMLLSVVLICFLSSNNRIEFDTNIGTVVCHRAVAGMKYLVESKKLPGNRVNIRIHEQELSRSHVYHVLVDIPTQQPLKIGSLSTEKHATRLVARLEQALREHGLTTSDRV